MFEQSSIVMSRLKYYNYSADITKYDLGWSIKHWNQYNDYIHNPLGRTDPNNLNCDLTIDVSADSLHDRLLISGEQIYLYLSSAETARSNTNYNGNLSWIKNKFPKMSLSINNL